MVKLWLRSHRNRSIPQSGQIRNPDATSLITSTVSTPPVSPSSSNSSNDSDDDDIPRVCLPLAKKFPKAREVLRVLDSPRRALLSRSGKKNFEILQEELDSEFPMNVDQNSLTWTVQRSQNVLWWLEHEAPSDIFPKILSYAGPQKVDSLSRVNKGLRAMCLSGDVWKTLCEDTQKWIPGKDQDPFQDEERGDMDDDYELRRLNFWKKYYCDNPIVPIDYSTIPAAVKAVADDNDDDTEELDSESATIHSRNVRVLIRPGNYTLAERIHVHVKGAAKITFETLEYPEQIVDQHNRALYTSSRTDITSRTSNQRRRMTRSDIREFLTCRPNANTSNQSSNFGLSRNILNNTESPMPMPTKATIEFKTKKMNEPIFHVSQGTLQLSNLVLKHNCSGTDIWNGNTAVQSQPMFDDDDRPVRESEPNTPPTVIAEDCDIMSVSGRGIVAIDGGASFTRRCYIHHCAATGLYIGGPGSTASVESSDIVLNGNGNVRNRRGITRGHSGVYLEQGEASLTDCNISNNSLTGISAVSKQNAFLRLEGSDLIGNGTVQLDMPAEGTRSRSRSFTKDNKMAADGYARPRSGFMGESDDTSTSESDQSQSRSTRRRTISISSNESGM